MTTQTAKLGRTIEREMVIQASPSEVFAAFVEKIGLESWFVLRAEMDPTPGGAFSFSWASNSATGRVVEVDPPRRLVLEWDALSPMTGITTSVVELSAVENGTLLRIVNSGFGEGADWDGFYEGVSAAWTAALHDLQIWFETGNVVERGFRHG